MSEKPLANALVVLLIIPIVAPAAFLVAPQRATAAGSSVGCIGGLLGGAIGSLAQGALSVPNNSTVENITTNATAGATIGTCINDVILIPLARAAIRAILQKITASVVNWINNTPGKNGASEPSYVQNLSQNLQRLGDVNALAFFSQFMVTSNSPFATAIVLSLKNDYYLKTSVAGFINANLCTLTQSSPNVPAYLAGDWSQGGVGAWFALTTQSQNNPYLLYQIAQSQVASNVSHAQANRRQDLIQSGGFLSWCGTSDTAAQTQSQASAGYQACIAQCNANGYSAACADSCGTSFSQNGGSAGGASGGVNIGDSCTNSDGTPGSVVTPGSVIHDYTQKAVVASGFDQLVSANDLDSMLGSIVAALANQVLSGIDGLYGASAHSSNGSNNNRTLVSQLQNYSASSVGAPQSAFQTAQTMLTHIASYTTGWNTVTTAAQTASVSVKSLANSCTTAAGAAGADPRFVAAATAQATAAQTALTSEISPVIAQAQTVVTVAPAARTFALQVQSESLTTPPGASLASDVATLVTMTPSALDAANAQASAAVTNRSSASPAGSLTVSGGTLVDQMNLISANAATLKTTVCNPFSSQYQNTGTGGGGSN